MSLFNWFSRKNPVSGPQEAEGTSPSSWPSQGHGHGTSRGERHARRELLYAIVRESMTQAGVLSASYKFKVLSLDSSGNQYVVMMDVPRELVANSARLPEMESLIARNAKNRHDIVVASVYWRINEQVTVASSSLSAAMPQVSAPAASASKPAPSQDFQETQIVERPSPLSGTQFGELR
jgi:hypothetical protein